MLIVNELSKKNTREDIQNLVTPSRTFFNVLYFLLVFTYALLLSIFILLL